MYPAILVKNCGSIISRAVRLTAIAALFLLPTVTIADVPLEEFTKLPLYNDLKISPTGEYLAATVRDDNGEASLLIMRADGSEVTARVSGFRDYFIGNFFWANDERIVASLGRQ